MPSPNFVSIPPMKIDVEALYKKYGTELLELSFALRPIARAMESQGFGVAFGDVEGELLYMTIREKKPSVVFEISPNAGWSTNYILAALTANAHGALHSFELETQLRGRPTEQVIRDNLLPFLDQKRLTVHLGDALKTTETVPGTIDFLLIDSCHDQWFAEWYTSKLFPRCNGVIYVQDIAFIDRLDNTTEASFFWNWLKEQGTSLTMVGDLERRVNQSSLRDALAERMRMRSNSLIFEWPNLVKAPLPQLIDSPEKYFSEAEAAAKKGDRVSADRALSRGLQILGAASDMSNRHRLYLAAGRVFERIGQGAEAQTLYKRALSCALQGTAPQRAKGLSESLEWSLVHFRPCLAAQTAGLILFEPAAWGRSWSVLFRAPMTVGRDLARRLVRG